ncbi:HDIG domain-containing metalloprotein [Alloiococcus sp. CFN-8]|uniref:HD domain-containing protein n=1 Tax=Alloiococcus sp. CFN-8 TaxID=3416081 RepID=UPI003CFA9461
MNYLDIYKDINEVLLSSEKPSKELYVILESINDLYPFTMIVDMASVPQEPKYHPEGDVLIHTMMVVDEAARRRGLSTDEEALMWSALLHDLGKKETTKRRKGRWTSYDHDKVGEEKVKNFFYAISGGPELMELSNRVEKLTRWHMQTLFITKKLPFADVDGMFSEVDIQELALLSLCDRLGRGGLNRQERLQVVEQINEFLTIVGKQKGVKYKKFNNEGMDYN